jgi:DNA-directed RNA polymerase subunit RPC12/RpoP
MGELEAQHNQANVNVTLGSSDAVLGDLADKEFPCPLCGTGLPILASKRKKPYFTCNTCGVQVFVRGKTGISKLKQMAHSGILISGRRDSQMHGIVLFNRLEQLKLQKKDLEWKQGIFLKDKNVENVIQTVDAEIKKIEGELADLAAKKEKE